MRSEFSKEEFKSTLTGITTKGEPNIMGTPFVVLTLFDLSFRPFYGQVNDSWFRITWNSTFLPTPFIISGKYHSNNHKTEINYQIEKMWWVRVGPVLAFILFNSILIANSESIPLSVFLFLNAFIALGTFFTLFITNIQKKKMLKRFISEMEINVE
jgi:hypothetical protein